MTRYIFGFAGRMVLPKKKEDDIDVQVIWGTTSRILFQDEAFYGLLRFIYMFVRLKKLKKGKNNNLFFIPSRCLGFRTIIQGTKYM